MLRTNKKKPNTHPNQSPKMPHFYWGSLQLSPANSQSQQTWRLSFFLFASESAKTQVVNKQTLLFSWLVLVYFHSCRDKPGGAAHREACHRYWFSFFLSNCSGMLKNASIVCKFYYFNWESLGTALLLIHGTPIYLMTVVNDDNDGVEDEEDNRNNNT